MNGTPRKISSGGATELPSSASTVATTMKTPSADSVRRSRSATSSGSPMSTPSTKIIPECTCLPNLAPLASISSGRPLRPLWMRSVGTPDRLGQLRVQVDPLVVAVKREHVARPRQVEHQLQLLARAVAGDVDRRVGRGHDAGADLEDAVDRLVDRALVARDRRRREDHRVAGVQLDVAVVVEGHPPQRRERLALAAGRDRDHLLVGEVLDLLRRDQQPGGRVGDPEVGGDVEVLAHRAPDQGDLAGRAATAASITCWTRCTFEAKQVTMIRPSQRENCSSSAGPTLASDGHDTRAVGVGRVAAQAEDALGAELGEPRDVGRDGRRPASGRTGSRR